VRQTSTASTGLVSRTNAAAGLVSHAQIVLVPVTRRMEDCGLIAAKIRAQPLKINEVIQVEPLVRQMETVEVVEHVRMADVCGE
jgi:hypothetical protein